MYKIGYEQTDEKTLVEIYGLPFEVKKIGKDLVSKLNELRNKDVEEFDELYEYVDLFLGDGASDKINAKRKEDGYNELNYENILAILELVLSVQRDKFKTYETKYNNYRKYNNKRGRRY